MKKIFIIAFCIALSANGAFAAKNYTVKSPDGRTEVSLSLGEGQKLYYSVVRDGKTILKPSLLGLDLKDEPDMIEGFKVMKATPSSFSETWHPVWGEESSIDNNYNELRLDLAQPKLAPSRKMAVVFRAFDDGIGFRYEFPKQPSLGDFTIMDELTEFNFPEAHKSWSISLENDNFYEGTFRDLPLDSIGWATTPVTIKADENTYMAIHEANLTDYAAMNLDATPGSSKLKARLTPWSTGEKVFVTDVRTSPWRTLIITDTPADLMLSRLMLNLNEPCRIEDTSWIKPQRYIGIWWSMHLDQETWYDGERHGATTENAKRYIDFAAANNFGGVLAEGWNKDWKTYKFSFTESYPDFDIKEVADYARDKGVGFLSHHETCALCTNYENQLEGALQLLEDNGINYVKTGYAGMMMDEKERHSSQYGVRHFRKVIEEAAKHKVAIDNHEPVIPTGLQRTYPNLMTQEGVKGQEWNAWAEGGGNPPYHVTLLPFTRALAGPMDYTPGIFRFEDERLAGTRVNSTLAQQLALFVVLYSPLQMAADKIESYEENPAPFQFFRDCPTDWDRTLYPEAEIGKYVTVARKEKNSDNWFVAGITNEDGRTANIDFSFLDPDSRYTAIVYRDGAEADWATNPYPVTIERIFVDSKTVLPVKVAAGGGFAMKISKNN